MKLLFLFFLSLLTLFASDINQHKIKILEKVITEISIKKEILVWSDNEVISTKLRERGKLKITTNCIDATVLILEKKENLTKRCKSKYIFVLNYKLLSEIPQSFGALFWKKGRPNIVILEPRIKAKSINISRALEPYLEERVW